MFGSQRHIVLCAISEVLDALDHGMVDSVVRRAAYEEWLNSSSGVWLLDDADDDDYDDDLRRWQASYVQP